MQVGELLSLYHFDAVAFLVHKHPGFLTLNEMIMPLVLPFDLIVVHLVVQVDLVSIEQVLALRLHHLLFLLLLLLSIHNGHMLFTGDPGFLLHASIKVSELLLTTLMKLLKVSFMLGLFFCLPGPKLELSLFIRLLGTNLINSSLPILGPLLKLSQALHFALFLFLDSLFFTSFSLFALNFLTVVFCNLLINLSLSLTSGNFLLFSILIGYPDFFVHDLELLPLGGKLFSIFSFDLFNVGKELGFFQFGLVLLLLTVDLTLSYLID